MILFLGFFFQSDRPTQCQETHSTLNEKKKGDGLNNIVRVRDCGTVKELCRKLSTKEQCKLLRFSRFLLSALVVY